MPVTPKQQANLRPYKKGESGNPKGKPKGAVSYTTALKRLLREQPELLDKGAKAMIKQVNRGNVGMTQIVLDRVDGPNKQKIDVSVYSEAFDKKKREELEEIIEANER